MAAEAVYVDLDLKGNTIDNVRDAAAVTEVPNWGQVQGALTTASHPAATAGVGIAPIDPTTQVVGIADGGVGNLQLGANLYGLIDVERATTELGTATVDDVLTFDGTQWVGAPLPDVTGFVVSVTGTAPITVDSTNPDAPVIGIDPTALDFPVDSVTGTAPVIVTETVPGSPVISIDPAAFHVPAVAGLGIAPIDASQTVAVQLAPNPGLSLVDGLLVDVGVGLSRTVDGVSVNIGAGLADVGDAVTALADPAAGNALTVSAAGLFVPVTDTSTFATTAYVDAEDDAITARLDAFTITSDGSIDVSEATADQWVLSVNSLTLADTYTGSTGFETATINDDLTSQQVAAIQPGDLYINTTSGDAFIATSGTSPADALWTAFAPAAASVTAVNGTPGEIVSSVPTGPTTTISLDTAIKTEITTSTSTNTTQDGRLDALEASTHVAAVAGSGIAPIDASQTVAIQLNNESGLSLVGGLQVDTGEFISRGADGLAVNIGDGLVAGGVGTDSITVLAAPGGGIVVDATGVSVDASLVATPPVTLAFAPVAGGFEAPAAGPAGVATTVRVAGCVATLRVCEGAAGAYTVFANVDPSADGAVTLHFG